MEYYLKICKFLFFLQGAIPKKKKFVDKNVFNIFFSKKILWLSLFLAKKKSEYIPPAAGLKNVENKFWGLF